MMSLVELFVTIDHLDLVTLMLITLIALYDVPSSFDLQNEQCLLLGDFNMSYADWTYYHTPDNFSYNSFFSSLIVTASLNT
jgi:hypothetical protein